jgi:hypothetical protein
MEARRGDRIVIESEKVTQPTRQGLIEEILQEHPPRFRVRWDDGRETIVAPAAGSARIERAKAKAKAAASSKR